ncbi:tripeptidyl-peptidase II Tpp2 [Phytophthora pseudosyringae]|uniref:Tripeptidyl-peptidase II Tpp2 n=1 Tax=Phytophthora pseudosyringae TaxID=221518 RepID=A0A8T1WET0_9STRA|nr:tripeptidyl-peptidase II Tpp2 [Phytophthora pseudosyringae]
MNRSTSVWGIYLSSFGAGGMSDTESARNELGPGQKTYVLRCYEFMAIMKKQGIFRGQKTRDLVAECLQIAHDTVANVRKENNEDSETKSEVKCHSSAQEIRRKILSNL